MTEQTDAEKVISALQTLTQLGLDAAQIGWLLHYPERTLEQVQMQLNNTDAVIRRAKLED